MEIGPRFSRDSKVFRRIGENGATKKKRICCKHNKVTHCMVLI